MAAVSGRAPLPATPAPEQAEQDFTAQIRQLQDELADSVERGGLARDPYRFVTGALAHTLGVFPSVLDRLEDAVVRARQPVDPAALQRLETAAASGAAKRAAELARASNLRTFLLAGTIAASAVLVAGAGGFWWGRHTQEEAIASTEAGLAAAFRDGPDAAASWLTFMQTNDGNLVREACAKSTVRTPDGRRACAVGLWVDLLPNPPPRTEPTTR
jgi:hypothetical protein